MKFAVHVLIYASVLTCVVCRNYFLGDSEDSILLNTENVIFSSVADTPWLREIYAHSYYDYLHREITAIKCYDNWRTEACVFNTLGGVGYSYMMLYLVSESGIGLNYNIDIYTNNKTVVNSTMHTVPFGRYLHYGVLQQIPAGNCVPNFTFVAQS